MPISVDKASVPKVAPGVDFGKLKIGAREGFVLSRLDGHASIAQLATLCALPLDEVERIITRLMELRAAFVGEVPPWSIAPPPTPPPVVEIKPKATTSPRTLTRSRARKWGPTELEEPAELEPELKGRILDLHGWLDDMDHYELLAVPRDADKKAIKSAYYQLAVVFHTDRYFGKSLGSFKSKMEAIFGRITLAHDILANKTKRKEYDEYLVDRDRTRAFEAYLAGQEAYEEEKPPEPEPEPPPVSAPASVAETPPPSVPLAVAGAPVDAPADEARARREALARRLMGASSTRLRTAPITSPAPSAPLPTTPDAARDALKRRYEETRDGARRAQANRLIRAADKALETNDLLAAANNLRLALNYDDTPELRARYEATNLRARDAMADTYVKQARYEEGLAKWGPAALNYVKAHEGRPDDPALAERAAHALRMEGRDLHTAARLAEIAVQKSPSSADFRVTLGAVYLDAGLFLRARTELEQAAKIDPNSATIKDLLARARRMTS